MLRDDCECPCRVYAASAGPTPSYVEFLHGLLEFNKTEDGQNVKEKYNLLLSPVSNLADAPRNEVFANIH